jgi:ribonuclease VapC
MSAINVGEVYYFLQKQNQTSAAENWRRGSATLPVSIDIPRSEHIWGAAELKARFPISYADAFAGELARRYACPLITGDPEFRSVDVLTLDWVGR